MADRLARRRDSCRRPGTCKGIVSVGAADDRHLLRRTSAGTWSTCWASRWSAGLEKAFALVKTLITEGPMAAWEQLKDMAGEMRDAFVDAVKDFIKSKIIEQAIIWLGQPVHSRRRHDQGDHRHLRHDRLLHPEGQADREDDRQLPRLDRRDRGRQHRRRRRRDGEGAGARAVAGDQLPRKLLRLDGITAKIRNAIQKIRAKVDGVLAQGGEVDRATRRRSCSARSRPASKKLLNWWKKKVPVERRRREAHADLRGKREERDSWCCARLPQLPSDFLDGAGKDKRIAAGKRTTPVETAKTHEKAVKELQTSWPLRRGPRQGRRRQGPHGRRQADGQPRRSHGVARHPHLRHVGRVGCGRPGGHRRGPAARQLHARAKARHCRTAQEEVRPS